jgi:hypothetical protein
MEGNCQVLLFLPPHHLNVPNLSSTKKLVFGYIFKVSLDQRNLLDKVHGIKYDNLSQAVV